MSLHADGRPVEIARHGERSRLPSAESFAVAVTVTGDRAIAIIQIIAIVRRQQHLVARCVRIRVRRVHAIMGAPRWRPRRRSA